MIIILTLIRIVYLFKCIKNNPKYFKSFQENSLPAFMEIIQLTFYELLKDLPCLPISFFIF